MSISLDFHNFAHKHPLIVLICVEMCENVPNTPNFSKIKSLRLKHRLSQNWLSRKAELDRATISAAENGKSVSDLTLSKIADALGVEVGDIDERL